MAARSLRRDLLLWLVLPLVAVVSVNVWTAYTSAVATADLITERTLLASARVIAEAIHSQDGLIEAPIPPSALEMFAGDEPDRVVYRVLGPKGDLIAGYPDSLVPPQAPTDVAPVVFSGRFREAPIRAVAIVQPLVNGASAGSKATVVVGQTLHAHDRLVTGLWISALRSQVVLVVAASLLAAFGLRRGLAPVMRLRDAVRERDPAVLNPFSTANVQTELRPLVEALNEAFARVQRQITTQRRFVANAAHQLRTPLTLLKTQATVGLREADGQAKDEVLVGINAAVDRMTHLANQLLALARAEQGGTALRRDIVDLQPIARAALEDLAVMAVAHGIDLGLDSGGEPLLLLGHATLLRELVMNLIDNAIRYTPAGGVVTAHLARRADAIAFSVEDTGPGIPAAEREAVFERFYRRIEGGGDGSGLGLAVVKEIVQSHDGRVSLRDRADGGTGLVVTVEFPIPI